MGVGKRTSLRAKLEKRVKSGGVAKTVERVEKRKDDSLVSKSALRRRKRKMKEQLKPKLEDLAQVLEEVPATATHSKLDHTPNPHKRGAKIVEKVEIKRFGAVLKDEQFRKSPFDALKRAIANNS
ncbi:hypothetical protein KL925_005232 [Ogataea polymorpha]|uniref:uncharacterized protein n=1 Tax=Ogataea polymorpha TaxID=460523 RepID=UPI0007F53B58|nr:uncharacterized protein OGAPODRAFT_92042 [Ogataea polymorpha]KAG7924612.1 hypothetical protein KL925_005232 [Ogataea polymorpha]KAG7930147.1 hypothetical protein KL934_005077 [Ogataea polymorpha]OBA18563.1 hypothetical protein OGAPODRAFT_92042 [Ogataea polymorpha]